MSEPELCLLTYRFVPPFALHALEHANREQKIELNNALNELTKFIQKHQRETGRSFVSRTQLTPTRWDHLATIVFRVVLANPLTTETILQGILQEQREIARLAPQLMTNIENIAYSIVPVPAPKVTQE